MSTCRFKHALVTVTELEMRARPNLVRPPAPEWARPAILHAPHIPLAYYRFLYEQVGRPWHWTVRADLDDAALAAEIHAPEVEIYVLYLEGAPAGFYELLRQSREVHYLIYFGLMRHWHGKGIGRFFLAHAIDTLWAGEPKVVRLGTCTLDHPAALGLYQKMGFSPVGQWKRRRPVFADQPLPETL